MIEMQELSATRGQVPLHYAKGHFATNHSHINYYIDMNCQKTRLNDAKATAHQLVSHFINNTPIDTVLCLDGTAVLGTCVADELTRCGFYTMNQYQTIHVVEPEYSSSSQIIFRENIQPMIRGQYVLVLMASVTTGVTASRSIEAITYYGGKVAGVAGIFRAVDAIGGYPVRSVYSLEDLPDYRSYDYRECPYCKAGQPLDALVNSFGYSKL